MISFILSIIGLVVVPVSFLSIKYTQLLLPMLYLSVLLGIMMIVALIFGILGVKKKHRIVLAKTGIIISSLSLIAFITYFIVTVALALSAF